MRKYAQGTSRVEYVLHDIICQLGFRGDDLKLDLPNQNPSSMFNPIHCDISCINLIIIFAGSTKAFWSELENKYPCLIHYRVHLSCTHLIINNNAP